MRRPATWILAAAGVAGALALWAAPGSRGRTAAGAAKLSEETATATFAGGCFWCMEPPFDELAGVVSTTSGYTGGRVADPTYEQVSSGGTGHTEAVQVVYDPSRITYEELLDVFWLNVDPEAEDRQFCDRGTQYRSGIFVHDAAQRKAAEESKRHLETSGKVARVVTEVTDFAVFYPAEEYHQDYYEKNPVRYKLYRTGCGRDRRLADLWGS